MSGSLAEFFGSLPDSGAPGHGFTEEPVPLSVFVQDRKYLANPPLSPDQYEGVRHIEKVYYPQTYQLLARSDTPAIREYWRQPCRMVNLLTFEWGKGCKIAGMEFYDAATGLWETVEAAPTPGVVASMRPGLAPEYGHRGPFVKAGSGRCLEVTTRSGYVTTVHEHHQFLTREGSGKPFWRCLTQMQEGDWVATSRSLPEPQYPLLADSREVELVGLWLGDGNMPKYTMKPGPELKDGSRRKYRSLSQLRMYVGHAADVERARYRELCESFEGVTLRQQDTGTKWLLTFSNNYAHANPVTEVARRWGLYGKTFRDKRVPRELMGLCRSQVALLLSRLIDTDGSVYFEKTGRPRIEFASVSPGLILDVRRLMLRLGARATVRERVTRCQQPGCEGHLSSRLVVTDDQSLAALAAELTLLDKQPRLEAVRSWLSSRKVPVRHLHWDRIKSLRDAGTHEFYDTTVTGDSGPEWPSEMTLLEPETEAGAHNYLSTGFLDHNAGKDHICRIGSLRIAYLLLCLPDPQAYYAMPAQDTIHLLNVASSAPQASRAFFAPLRRAVQRPGNWFETTGVEVVEVRDPRNRSRARQSNVKALLDTVRFSHNIEAVSGHSDADSQEGLNLLAGMMDEVDAFKSRAELAKLRGNVLRESSTSAESVLAMLQTSASTRFPEVYKVVRISYPRYLGSTIQQLGARGRKDIEEKGEASRHYVSGPKATWEVNPRVPGKHVFQNDYDEDPVMAAAKYECKPSRAVNPYFANMLAVEACLEEHPEPPLQVAYVRDGHAWKPVYSFAARLYPVRGAAYAIHADMAISRDRAGVALAHVARWDEVQATGHDGRGREVAVLEPRPVVKVDFSAAFEANIAADPPLEIQVRWFRDLVLELMRRGFNIRLATMDGFQSADSLQILETHGIETDRVSTDLSEEPWRALRNLAYEDRLRGHKDPLLIIELAGLSKLPNGKIDHPADGSKDVADAVACACTGAIVLGGSEDPSGARAYLAGEWAHAEPEEMPAGMPASASHLSYDSELPDYAVASGPDQVSGPGWLFSDTGESYTGQV